MFWYTYLNNKMKEQLIESYNNNIGYIFYISILSFF